MDIKVGAKVTNVEKTGKGAKVTFEPVKGGDAESVEADIVLIATGRILPGLPDWVGYLLIANGLVDIFVIPSILVKKWRTPK